MFLEFLFSWVREPWKSLIWFGARDTSTITTHLDNFMSHLENTFVNFPWCTLDSIESLKGFRQISRLELVQILLIIVATILKTIQSNSTIKDCKITIVATFIDICPWLRWDDSRACCVCMQYGVVCICLPNVHKLLCRMKFINSTTN